MPRPPLKPKACENCGLDYVPVRLWQKYCSIDCRQAVFYRRQAAKDPLAILTPRDGPTPAQEAEWQRRHTEAVKLKEEELAELRKLHEQQEERNKRESEQKVRAAEEKYLGDALGDLGYGQGDKS